MAKGITAINFVYKRISNTVGNFTETSILIVMTSPADKAKAWEGKGGRPGPLPLQPSLMACK